MLLRGAVKLPRSSFVPSGSSALTVTPFSASVPKRCMYALTFVGVNDNPRAGVTFHWAACVVPDGRSFRKVTFSPASLVAWPVLVPVTSMSPRSTVASEKPSAGMSVVTLS